MLCEQHIFFNEIISNSHFVVKRRENKVTQECAWDSLFRHKNKNLNINIYSIYNKIKKKQLFSSTLHTVSCFFLFKC